MPLKISSPRKEGLKTNGAANVEESFQPKQGGLTVTNILRLFQKPLLWPYGCDFLAPERSVLQYVSTGAQKIAPIRPP
jgi:hypothetical protein